MYGHCGLDFAAYDTEPKALDATPVYTFTLIGNFHPLNIQFFYFNHNNYGYIGRAGEKKLRTGLQQPLLLTGQDGTVKLLRNTVVCTLYFILYSEYNPNYTEDRVTGVTILSWTTWYSFLQNTILDG